MPKENVKSRPKIEFTIPIGKNGKDIKFEDFYKKFNSPREIIETKEWKDFYSHFYEFTELELDIDIKETVAELEEYDEEQQIEEIEKLKQENEKLKKENEELKKKLQEYEVKNELKTMEKVQKLIKQRLSSKNTLRNIHASLG